MNIKDIMNSDLFNWCAILGTFAAVMSIIFSIVKRGQQIFKRVLIKIAKKPNRFMPIKVVLYIILVIIIMVFVPAYLIIYSSTYLIGWKFYLIMFISAYLLFSFIGTIFTIFKIIGIMAEKSGNE